MTWEAIQPAVSLHASVAAAPEHLVQIARSTSAVTSGFGSMVERAVGEVNQQLLTSQTDLQQMAMGEVQNLHQIMIRLEESRLSFQLMLQVRNRLLEAYQDIMRMQV